jgi:hypothetical protein
VVNGGDYRTGAVSVEEAGAVLVSLRATGDQRIGAALALRIAGAPTEQIRVATRSIADDRVRVVIAGIADAEDEEEVVRALRSAR